MVGVVTAGLERLDVRPRVAGNGVESLDRGFRVAGSSKLVVEPQVTRDPGSLEGVPEGLGQQIALDDEHSVGLAGMYRGASRDRKAFMKAVVRFAPEATGQFRAHLVGRLGPQPVESVVCLLYTSRCV